jgi:hypothetical protein
MIVTIDDERRTIDHDVSVVDRRDDVGSSITASILDR